MVQTKILVVFVSEPHPSFYAGFIFFVSILASLFSSFRTSFCLLLRPCPPRLVHKPQQGLEFIMRKFGTVRSVEVAPSVLSGDDATTDSPAAVAGTRTKPVGFDVHALLENMPQPRALAKGKGGGGRGSGGGGVGGVGLSGVVSVGLNVDAWVQFASFGSFKRALKGLQGRVLQKAGADLMCEYRLGVDVAGHMTEEKRRERDLIRRQDTKEVLKDEWVCFCFILFWFVLTLPFNVKSNADRARVCVILCTGIY